MRSISPLLLTCLGHYVFGGLYGDEEGVEHDDGQDGEAEPSRLHQAERKLTKSAPAGSYQLALFVPEARE